MEEKQYYLPDQEHHFLSGQALDKLLRRADGTAALVYLYILKYRGKLSVAGAMEALRLSEQEVYDALGVLATLGLVAGSGTRRDEPDGRSGDNTLPERDELPQYSAEDIQREMGENASFASLKKEVENILGKILTTPDLNTLMGMYHHLGLPPEVIYQLISHLTAEHREKYGEGKSPTMRGIEKVAYTWAREGVNTLDLAMERIARREEQKSRAGRVKKALDIRQDKLTPTQERYIFSWLDMGFDDEVIALAYDKTVVATGQLKWNYLHKILTSWNEKGLKTLEEVEQAEGGRSRGRGTPAKQASPAPDRQEIERRKRLLEKMGE